MEINEFERQVDFAARLRILEEKVAEKPKESKPNWLKFFESASGAAMVTVLIGGIMGTLITSYLQSNEQDRQRKMKLYNITLQEHNKAVNETTELLGDVVRVITNFAESKGPKFGFIGIKTYDDQIKKQIEDINAEYNHIQVEWNKKKIGQGSLLAHLSGNNKKIESKWREILDEMGDYMEFSESLNGGNFPNKMKEIPEYEIKILMLSNELMDMLSEGRQELWEKLNQ